MSKPQKFTAAALQMRNHPRYEKNLERLLQSIQEQANSKLIVAPEVCLTDYDYAHMEEAVDFSRQALVQICEAVDRQIVVLTLLTKTEKGYSNEAVVIHRHKVVHRQSKHKLFALGEEDRHLIPGRQEMIRLFEIEGVKYGLMICFELRFKTLWKQLEGADVILLPSQWGLPRKKHLEVLSQALAIMNQCYVVVANSAKETMASSSAIYSPSGGVVIDDMKEVIRGEIDFSLIKKMRRYIVMH